MRTHEKRANFTFTQWMQTDMKQERVGLVKLLQKLAGLVRLSVGVSVFGEYFFRRGGLAGILLGVGELVKILWRVGRIGNTRFRNGRNWAKFGGRDRFIFWQKFWDWSEFLLDVGEWSEFFQY